MAKKNRYAGVLKPRLVGLGSPETAVLVLYDIEDDKLRTRIAGICFDYGLDRIQFSAFLGKLNRNRREEMVLRFRNEVENSLARLRVIPICQEDFAAMWILDQYCLPEEAAECVSIPQIRVVRAD